MYISTIGNDVSLLTLQKKKNPQTSGKTQVYPVPDDLPESDIIQNYTLSGLRYMGLYEKYIENEFTTSGNEINIDHTERMYATYVYTLVAKHFNIELEVDYDCIEPASTGLENKTDSLRIERKVSRSITPMNVRQLSASMVSKMASGKLSTKAIVVADNKHNTEDNLQPLRATQTPAPEHDHNNVLETFTTPQLLCQSAPIGKSISFITLPVLSPVVRPTEPTLSKNYVVATNLPALTQQESARSEGPLSLHSPYAQLLDEELQLTIDINNFDYGSGVSPQPSPTLLKAAQKDKIELETFGPTNQSDLPQTTSEEDNEKGTITKERESSRATITKIKRRPLMRSLSIFFFPNTLRVSPLQKAAANFKNKSHTQTTDVSEDLALMMLNALDRCLLFVFKNLRKPFKRFIRTPFFFFFLPYPNFAFLHSPLPNGPKLNVSDHPQHNTSYVITMNFTFYKHIRKQRLKIYYTILINLFVAHNYED
ncbi:hypothetical protein RFI_17728 [Reticulomyxa filosa]|uniref:Uncharacterized protein n=1 Tax=Reticulomyxa filosa TaxID=46433 RepID=X6N2G5_RETFI|nr:hypothetical protein RFI_17728 [Reticulomyxa filosa]|eukprot:ETO19502.1 hypothetical protein RFI_17728 [Reticulomyxa filosa]